MEASVREFASENPNADYYAIVSHFGTPRLIAESCIAEMETAELLDGMQIRRRILLVALAVAAMLVIIRFGFRMAAYLDFYKDMHGYAVVEVIEIERTEIDKGEEK